MKSELIREANDRRERRDSIGPPPLSPHMKSELIQQANARRERQDSIPPPPLSPLMKSELIKQANARRERQDSIPPPPINTQTQVNSQHVYGDSIPPPPFSPRMKSELIHEVNVRRERQDSIGPPPMDPAMKTQIIQEARTRQERKDSIGPPPPFNADLKVELIREATVRRVRADSIGPPPDPLQGKALEPHKVGDVSGHPKSMSNLRQGAPHSLPPPTLATVLVNEELRNDFARFLDEEFATENLEFIEACDAFADTKMAPEAIEKEAKRIYNQFIIEGAPQEVNISGPMRKAIKKAVFMPKHGVVYQGIFEDAARELSHLLEANFMVRWLAKNTWRTIYYVPNQQSLPTLKQVLEHYRLRNQFELFLVAEDKEQFLYLWEALTRLTEHPNLEEAQSILSRFPEQLQTIPETMNTLSLAVTTESVEHLKSVDPTPIFRTLQVKWYSHWVVLQTWSLVKVTVNPSSFIPAALQQEEVSRTTFTHIHADDETSAIAAIAAANALATANVQSPSVCYIYLFISSLFYSLFFVL